MDSNHKELVLKIHKTTEKGFWRNLVLPFAFHLCPSHPFVESFPLFPFSSRMTGEVGCETVNTVSHVYFKEQQSINLGRVGCSLVYNNRPRC